MTIFLQSWTDRATILKSVEDVSVFLLTHVTGSTVANIIIIASEARNHIY